MVVHHVTTISLVVMSWTANMVRVGTLVLCVHDAVDYFLEVLRPALAGIFFLGSGRLANLEGLVGGRRMYSSPSVKSSEKLLKFSPEVACFGEFWAVFMFLYST